MKKILVILGLSVLLIMPVYADDFGHEGKDDEYATLEDMLEYALEDEVLAYETYALITEHYDVTKPFTNIMKAELTHQDMILDLMDKYNIPVPDVDPSDYLLLPDTLEEAYKTGIYAEVENIALYESFLEKDIPEDVKEVFEYLIQGSENHLAAFERQVNKTSFNGNRRGR